MANFQRERPDAGYYIGLATEGTPAIWTVLRNIDEKTKKALSGTGGTWNPSSPIIIGGAGIELQARADFAAASVLFPAADKAFIFGDDDYFQYASADAYTRTVDHSPIAALAYGFNAREFDNILLADLTTPSVKALRHRSIIRIPLKVHDGARCTRVDTFYRVTMSHTSGTEGIPAELPKQRVIKVARDGTITPFGVDAAQQIAEPEGWIREAQPASAAAYYNAGNVKTVSMFLDATDETGHIVNTSQYSYFYEFSEEGGDGAWTEGLSGSGNKLEIVRLYLTIPDLRPQ